MATDYSTIDRDKLAKLPTYALPASYHLGDEGNGCYLEPPGHPSYFTRSVYTGHGDYPSKGPIMLLLGHVVRKADDTTDVPPLADLYVPLPYEHPRVEAWERTLYRHLRHCYPTEDPRFAGSPEYCTIFYPVPSYKLESFRDDPRFSEEWRTAERERVAQANAETEAVYAAIAKPENHAAVLSVRKW